MINIIVPGKNPNKTIYTGSCRNCKCSIECLQEDAKVSHDFKDNSLSVYINCPTAGCNTIIYLYEK